MIEERSARVWRDWLTLYGATLAGQLVSAARSLLVAGLLGPTQFGLWKSLQLALSYTTWTDLGAVRGLGREVPLLRGEGRDAETFQIERASWFLTLLPSAIVALCMVLAGAWLGGTLGNGLMAFAPVLLSSRVVFFLFEVANASKAFVLKSQAMLGLALIDGAIAPIAAWQGGVWLFMASVAATNLLITAFLTVKLPFTWKLSWDSEAVRRVVAVGFPIALSGLAFGILKTVDRFVIATFLGTEAVGLYGLAIIVFDLTVMVPTLLSQVLLPHVVERFGRDRDSGGLFDQAQQIIGTVTFVLPIFLAGAWLLLPRITAWLLPAYVPGIGAARVLVWAAIFLSVHAVGFVVLVTLRRIRTLVVLHVSALVLALALCIVAVEVGAGIAGVAWAMLLTYGVTAGTEYVVAGSLCGRKMGVLLSSFVGSMLPCALAAALALAMEGWVLPRTGLVLLAVAVLVGGGLCAFLIRRGAAPVPRLEIDEDRHVDPRSIPLVSVILPVWNGAEFIATAVQSILDQTHAALELIIVDDHSDDATPDILSRLTDPRVRIIRLEKRLGGPAARNRGIRAARGKYIAQMDADDCSAPRRLERQVEFLETHPEHGMVTSGFDCTDGNHRILDRVQPPLEDGDIRKLLIRANPFAHSSVMMRREALETSGLYDERSYAQEYDLYLRLAQRWKLACLDEVLHRVRVHPDSETVTRENRVCRDDIIARLRAIARGQYPLSDLRHLFHTGLSMLVPMSLKQWRRRRLPVGYAYYHRPVVELAWGDAIETDLRRPSADSRADDVEGSDWRFLVSLEASSRILCLATENPTPLALSAPHSLLVVGSSPGIPTGLPATAIVTFHGGELPFRAASFDLVAVELDHVTPHPLSGVIRELVRVLRPDGTLHLAVPGRTRTSASWGTIGEVLRSRRRVNDILRELQRAGMSKPDCYARFPSSEQPRYMLACGDREALRFVLEQLPTYTKAGLPTQLIARVLGGWAQLARLLAPGLSIVARGAGR